MDTSAFKQKTTLSRTFLFDLLIQTCLHSSMRHSRLDSTSQVGTTAHKCNNSHLKYDTQINSHKLLRAHCRKWINTVML